METRMYRCQYCRKEYKPKRRRVQKFCSTSCRVGSHRLKSISNKELVNLKNTPKIEKANVDKMSWAGIGNSAAGTLAVEGLKALLLKEENKPATKSDLLKLEKRLNRYQEIKNMPLNMKNQKPFFDSFQRIIVYM